MEMGLIIVVAVVVVTLAVAAITWFGPRPRQWDTNDLERTRAAEPLQPLSGGEPTDEPTAAESPREDEREG